jgi:hypothetical protein
MDFSRRILCHGDSNSRFKFRTQRYIPECFVSVCTGLPSLLHLLMTVVSARRPHWQGAIVSSPYTSTVLASMALVRCCKRIQVMLHMQTVYTYNPTQCPLSHSTVLRGSYVEDILAGKNTWHCTKGLRNAAFVENPGKFRRLPSGFCFPCLNKWM